MRNDDQQLPASLELKRLQQPAQNSIRAWLRIAGPVILLIGFFCFMAAAVALFTGKIGYFWIGFLGLPLMFVGGVLCMCGFMGAVVRFAAGETAPVAADTVNYMAEETKGVVETVSKAVAKGVVEGIEAGRDEAGEGKD